MNSAMQVLVVGGTGTLGRQIAKTAKDAGHAVRCMVRSPRKASFLQEWGCEITQGDFLKPETLDYSLEGIDAVIDSAAGSLSGPIGFSTTVINQLDDALDNKIDLDAGTWA